MDSFARFHHSLVLMTSHALVVLLAIAMLSSQHVQAQAQCRCAEIAAMMDSPESGMGMSSGSGMLSVSVENITVSVSDECNSYTRISWMLRGDSIMLSDVNFTITITDSMGAVNRTINIIADSCVHNATCGKYLTEFNYTNVDGLEKNEAYNVSIAASINETKNMHELLTPVVSVIANTTIPVPGELNITYALLGPENRTLVNQVVVENRTNGELEFIRQGFEIITFTNNTFYDLNFTQVNDMDIYDDYFIAAELRNEQPAYNNSIRTTVGNRLNITDIIPTANYTICLRAINCGGLGPEKCVSIIAPEAVPVGSPRNLTASPGMRNVTLMWLAPIQPNGNITYSYYVIDDEDMTVANGTTMDLGVTVTGLREFTNYTCNVTASTSVGSTDPATEMFTTLQGISGVVDDLMVTPANRSVVLTADPPPVSNGIIIIYIVSYNVDGSTNITAMNFTADNQQRLNGTLEMLLPFTNYVFSVRACTTVGCSNSSENITEMTLEDAPTMPIDLLVEAINATSVNLTWEEPLMSNGIVRSYTITVAILDDVTNVVQNQAVANSVMMSVITQLTPNTSYVVNVSAVTVKSGEAASMTILTPALPTAPLNVTVNNGNMLRTLIVEWEPPSMPGGVITTYMVTYDNITMDISSNDTIYTITGLSPYTNYSITVLACTSNGCGNNSDVAIGTTAEEAPNPPLNVNATTVNSTAIQISWDQPDITNGVIRYYTVVYRLNDSSLATELNSTDTMIVVADLDPFNNYVFYVLAFTVASSDPSDNVTAMTEQSAPSAPINVTARNVSSTSILVMWEPPMTRNGIIVSYRVEFIDNAVDDVNTTNTSVIIGMLEKFTSYRVRVFATTVAEGNGSVIVEVTTDEDTPGIPGDFFVNEINSTAITVSWARPGVTNGIITMYEIFYSLGNHSVLDDNAAMVPVTATANTSIISNLDPFTVYTVAVRAFTRIGPGNLTDTFSILTDPSSSSPPQNFSVMVLNSTAVELSWEYPELPNGEIRGYSILDAQFPDNEKIILNITLDTVNDASNQSAVVANLLPFTVYSFRVRAYSFGDQNERPNFTHIGIATDEIIVRTAEDVPEAPVNFIAEAIASTMVELSWGAPNVTNGILLYYTVEFYNDTDTLTEVYDNDTFNDIITGLNEYTLYSFVIYANTSAGEGDNATDIAETFEDRPSAPPQNVATTVVNSTAILIFWNPPPFLDQNGIIIGYQLMITNQNRTNSPAIVFTNITSYTANMLEEFEVYNIEIAAQTSIGFGPFSDPISNQTFEDVPSMEPQNVSIFAEVSQSFMLSWDPPLIGEQNGILIRYHVIVIETQIHYTDDGEEIRGMERYLNRTYKFSEGRTQLIDMLHPDYNYTVRIAAATEPGIGPFSDSITVRTDMDVPTEAPRNVSVTVDSSHSIMLTWERPPMEEENGLLVNYHLIVIETQIHYTDDGEEIRGMERYFLNRTYNVSERREKLIDMLHPDYNYTVNIAAATEPGIGPFSDPITVRTDMDVPTEAPRNVSVMVDSSRSIMLTWERPSVEEENGLLLIYHVIVIETQIHYTDDGVEIRGLQRYLNRTYNVSQGREQLIDMLHPDYNYTVRIAAATEPGIGPFSDPITVRTDMDVPTETPRNVNATVATSHSIMLEWDRPSLEEENGLLVRYHVIIIETQIHYTDDGVEIRGLQRYLNRTYNISEGRMQLVEMLHPDYNYTIRIAAATEPGIGPFSDPITVRTDMDAPTEAPTNVSVMVDSSRSIMLTWERPSPEEENGRLLIYHVIVIETQIHYTDDGEEIRGMERYLNRTYNVSEGRTQLIDMLHPDYNYTVRIAAATEPGIGPFSDSITVRTDMDVPTEAPRNVSVTVDSSHSIMLTWERPPMEEENGLLVNYHLIVIETQIHYTDDGEEIRGMERYFLNRTYNVSERREKLIDMLHPDYNYTVNIAAATEPGIGPFSDPITVRTDMDVPTEAPRNASVMVDSSRSIMLTWERPSLEEENGLLLIYHVIVIETQIHYTDDGEEIKGMERYLNRTYNVSEGREQLIDLLHPDYNYTVSIAAATEPGIGLFSDPITVRTDMDVPTEAPRNVSVMVDSSRSIMLTWERPPMDEENGILLIYHVIVMETQIHYTNDGEEIRGMERYLNRTYNVSQGREQLINMLHPDYNYTIRIAAATEPGIGPFSNPIIVRTDMDVPTEAPRNVSVTVNSSRSIMLTWERPSPDLENGLLLIYHVIVIETQIHYTNDGEEIRGMERYLNRAYNVSQGREQLIDMLHPDYNYTVRIAAATEPGIGPFSDPITVRTDMDVPTEAPRNVSVMVDSSRSIMLTWERPPMEEENGLLFIYHVIVIETQIHYTNDGEEISGLQRYLNRTYNVSERREQLIDMLHPDYNYTVSIAAATEPGIGPFSDPITVRTNMDAPTETPTNVNVTVDSSRSIMLTWERPSPDQENGLLLTYHVIVIETQIHYTNGGQEIRGMEIYLNRTYNVSQEREQLINMLHPDYNYTVRIAAATEPGIGPFSDPITVRTDMDVPTEAPRNVSVMVDLSRSIMLTWERPPMEEENGLLLIYHVIVIETQIHYTDDGEEIKGMEIYLNRTYNVSQGREQLIDMLHPDYNYTVSVAAATEPGIGPFSDPITIRTDMDAPTEAPRNVNVTVDSSRSIILTWERPSPDQENGLLLIYYVTVIETQIHYTDDGEEIRGTERYLNRTYDVSEGRAQLIGSLHPDYNYTVSIAAATEPGAAGSGTAASSAAAGIGPFSDSITVRTDMDVPTEAPRNVNMTVDSSRSIMLTWERPPIEEENGLLLIYHVIVIETQIHYTDDGEEIRGMEKYLNRTYNVSQGREQLINMLHPDYNYTVRIAAATEPGIGPFSDPITVRTDMDVPTEVPRNVSVMVDSSRSIMLTWERPPMEEENGLLLIYHVIVIETQIHYTDNGEEIRGMERYVNRTYDVSEGRAQLIDLLHPDYNYTVSIAAATEPGIGPFSDPITERTEMDVPTETPRNVSVTVDSSRSIMLTWERPSVEEENGLLLIYHVIVVETQIYRLDNGTAIRRNQAIFNETYDVSEGRAQLIDMLHPDYDYTVRIAAATEPGIGPFSDPITVRTYMDGIPQNFTVEGKNYTTVFISWERPIFTEENGIIVMYIITYNGSREEKQPDGTVKSMPYGEFTIQLDLVDGLPREIYITNMSTLVSNSEYHFEIRAATINGSGPPAVNDNVMIEQGTPSVPTDPPQIDPSPNISLPPDYPSDPIGHNTLTFVLPLPPEDDGELTEVSIIVQEALQNESSGAKLRSIDTWYKAFMTPYDPPLSIPPAYIAIEISSGDIEANRFKRGVDGYIRNRFVRQTSSGNLVIRLGNESCDPVNKTVCNGQLKPNTNYSVAYNACTDGGCAVSPLSAPLLTDVAPDEPINIGLIIGIVAGVVGAIIIVVIIIVVIVCCRRRSKHQKYDIGNNIHVRDTTSIRQRNIKRGAKSSLLLPASPLKKNGSFFETTEPVGPTIVPVKDQPSTYTSDDIAMRDNSRRIYLRDLPAHVADMANDSGYKFSEEYERVSEVGLDQPKEASLMAENRAKNRYTNILAYDHSRTKLSFVDDEPGSDYINANYIPGYKMKRAYIATQGPLPCTFDDFWKLIWEQNVHTIVMLTQLVERGRNKCHHYWPGMDSTRHGDVTIAMQSEREGENWTVREFILTQEKKERVVTQFQFTGWPDHGVPDNPGPVIDFVRTVRGQEDRDSTNRGPMLVHCSAGVGRTGTFIALDTLLLHINDHDWVDIYSVACEMRQHRNHMVQTEAQYIFIHKALQEVVESRSTFRYSVYRKSYAESDDNRELSPIMASTKM